MNDDRLVQELACRVFGWRLAPGRFLKSGRSWETRHRFKPLKSLDDAFRLLDVAATEYSLSGARGGSFTAVVRVGNREVKVTGKSKARAISLALAEALELEFPQ
jgi:ribosomal protein S5